MPSYILRRPPLSPTAGPQHRQPEPQPKGKAPRSVATAKRAPLAGMDDARRLTHVAREELNGMRYFVPDMTVAPTPAPTAPHLDTALGANRWVLSPEGLPSLWGNRAMVMLSATPHLGDAPVSLNFYQNMGALGTGASAALATGLRGGLDFFGGQHFLGGAGTFILGESNDRMGLGTALVGMGDHRLELLGPGTADDPPDSVWVRWNQHRGPGVAFDPMRFTMPFGLGGKAVVTQNERVEYTACISRRQLQEVVRQHPLHPHPLKALPCRIAMAVGLRPAPLALPDIADPLGLHGDKPALGIGESLTHRATANQSWALAPTLLAARLVGCRNSVQEREVRVQRLDPHHVRVVSAPRRSVAYSGSADVLLLAEAYHSHSRVRAEHQTFVLDLREAPAQALYARLVRGETVADPAESADSGITPIRREEAMVRSNRHGLGTPRSPVIPAAARIAGYGDHAQPFREQHVVQMGNAQRTTLSTGIEQERHRGVGGVQKLRLEAAALDVQAHNQDSAAVQRMAFRAQLSCDKMGSTAAAWLQETLGSALLEPPPGPSTARRHDTYDVLLEGTVDYASVAAATEARLAQVAQQSQLPAEALSAVAQRLRDTPDATRRGAAVRAFVDAHGLRGMAALSRLQRPDGALWGAQVRSSAWEQPLQSMHELLTLQGWAEALSPAASAAAEAPLADLVREAAAAHPLDAAAQAAFVRLHSQLQRAYSVAQEDPAFAVLAPQQRSALLAQLRTQLEVAQAAITAPSYPPSPHAE